MGRTVLAYGLALMAAGRSNKEIARQLDLSPNTVKTHAARLFEKLGAGRRTAAVRATRDLGLIPWGPAARTA